MTSSLKNSKTILKNPIFVALDVDEDKAALKIAGETGEFVGGFKIGPRLILRYGPKIVSEIAKLAPVFVDCKFHDIPSTVISALESTFAAGATFATVHASNGKDCLREVVSLEKRLASERPFQILAVTVLTSFNEKNLPSNWSVGSAEEHVLKLAKESLEAGITGLVCSPHEVAKVRALNSSAYLVTPGIRMPDASAKKDDQARTMTASEALKAGASALVIGRPIVTAKDPRTAAQEIVRSIT